MAQFISFQPSNYFNTLTYSGTGGNGTTTSQAITGAGFQPDWVWLKQRSGTQRYQLCDVIRGANNIIDTSQTNAQVADSDIINSFDSDGFTAGYQDQANDTGNTYVSWLWKAGGAASSNSNGSITSSVSASATSGFSIVQYTGTGANATVGHGLSTPPRFIIIKQTSGSANDFGIYYNPVEHLNGQQGRAMAFNSDGFSTSTSFWNNTITTNQVFYLGDSGRANQSGETYIAYCFSDVIGYQKFNGWYANANSNGPFIYTGFKPRYFIMFNINNSGRWMIADSKRNLSNEIDKKLQPHNNNAEATTSDIACDFLANGIKIKGGSTSDINHTVNNMMYGLAIAEEPLVSSNEIPATAR